jgi:hypothetical protein
VQLLGNYKALIHLAESETDLTRFCDRIGGYLYLASQAQESGFDFAKSIADYVFEQKL